jgi:hypothetical protein
MATHVKRSGEADVPSVPRADATVATTIPAPAAIMPGRDPASSFLAGYPSGRVEHSETGGQDADDDAAGMLTGYPGGRTADHVHAGTHGVDPATGVLAGYPGPRATHTETGGQGPDDPAAGVLTGYPGTRTPGRADADTAGTEPTTTHADDIEPKTTASDDHG